MLRAMLAHLGAMLAHLGAMLAHLGAILATPLVGSAGFLGPPFHRSVGAGKLLDGDLLQKYIPYVF